MERLRGKGGNDCEGGKDSEDTEDAEGYERQAPRQDESGVGSERRMLVLAVWPSCRLAVLPSPDRIDSLT